MKQPLVSIIIPAFNRARLLPEALDSVLQQTYPYWECIVVDDGSTDATIAVAKNYAAKDDRFIVLSRPQHRTKGANACRNFGMEQSTGSYINFLDSDDHFLPSKLEEQLAVLHLSFFDYCVVQTQWVKKLSQNNNALRCDILTTNDPFNAYVTGKLMWPVLAPLWKKEFLLAHQLQFDEHLHQSQEYDFHIRILAASQRIIVVEKPLAVMVQHATNLSASDIDSTLKVYSNLRAREKILQHYYHQLDAATLKNVHYYMHDMYRRLLVSRYYKKAWMALGFIVRNRSTPRARLKRSAGYICKVILAFPAYVLLKKGDYFLKFKY